MLTELFTEILVQIFKILNPQDIGSLNQTCRDLYEITTSNSYLWKVKFIERFGFVDLPVHLSWREFYFNYRVVWSFGKNVMGRLGQGRAPYVKYDYNKTKLDGRFVSAVLSNYSTAFLEPDGSVWASGRLTMTDTPVSLGIRAKQIEFDHQEQLFYIDLQHNLWQDGHRIQSKVKSFSFHNKMGLSIDLDGSLYCFVNRQVTKFDNQMQFQRVIKNVLQDISGRLWTQSGPLLLGDHHLPVRDFDVSDERVVVIDQNGELWINEGGQQIFMTKIPGRKFKSCSTDSYSSLLIDEEDQVWTWGLNSSGQLGPNTTGEITLLSGIQASFVQTRHDYSVIIGRTL